MSIEGFRKAQEAVARSFLRVAAIHLFAGDHALALSAVSMALEHSRQTDNRVFRAHCAQCFLATERAFWQAGLSAVAPVGIVAL